MAILLKLLQLVIIHIWLQSGGGEGVLDFVFSGKVNLFFLARAKKAGFSLLGKTPHTSQKFAHCHPPSPPAPPYHLITRDRLWSCKNSVTGYGVYPDAMARRDPGRGKQTVPRHRSRTRKRARV